MRNLLLVASVLAVLGGTASAGEVICGKDWISFQPLSPKAFSEELGSSSYLVRKADIRRGTIAIRGPLSQFGYLTITPLEGDARKTGEYRVTRAAYLEIRTCLIKSAPGENRHRTEN